MLVAIVALSTGSTAPGQTGSPYADAVLTDSPIGYWRLGETSGNVAADSSPNGLAGTYTGGVTLGVGGAINGDPNTAARFDGTNDLVSMGDPASGRLDFGTADFTVEALLSAARVQAHHAAGRG
jgi:hypothetical protein